MSFAWNPGAIPGLIALLTGLSMAALVLWTRPDRSQNRRLALLLALEGTTFGAMGGLFLATSHPTAGGFLGIVLVTMLLLPWAYLAFLATLDSPLVEPLHRPAATATFALAGGLAVASFLLGWDLFVERIVEAEVLGGYDWVTGPLGGVAFLGILASALFGLSVAVSVYSRTAEGSARRASARAYLAAFGLRDTLHAISLVYIVTIPGRVPVDRSLLDVAMGFWLPQVASILFSLLLAYGILRTQLFDIDLRIKWTVEKSTVAATFVAVFFGVSEGAQVLFADFAGSELLGVAAAALLVFALAPLQRIAEGVADTAMPGVEDTEAYREQRGRELYRAAVESAVVDGEITDKERDVLARIADELGLTSQGALELEREVLGAMGGEG